MTHPFLLFLSVLLTKFKEDKTEILKTGTDYVAVAVTSAAVLEWVPAGTACLTFVWMLIRIWETKTVRKLVKRRREKKSPEN